MNRRVWVAAFVLALGASGTAGAQGLSNKVYSPYVRMGVTELELRGGRLNGGPLDGEAGAIVELERGVSDRVSLAVLGEFERHAGEPGKLDAVAVEGVAYLGQIPGLGVDVGGYLEYEQRIHNESGKLEGKILLARQFGTVHGLLNLIAEQALTDRPGQGATEFGYAVQGLVDAGRNVQLGLQAFGDLGTNRSFAGRQAHYVGSVVRWEGRPGRAPGELELEAAYLLPVAAARHDADGQVRFALAWEKRF